MIVKIQTQGGFKLVDRVRDVEVGGLSGPGITRIINVAPSEGDQGPYRVICIATDTDVELLETNGDVFLLNDNGKTIDRI